MATTPKEIEFFAEKENVEIVPSFSLTNFYLIEGDAGPFRPGFPVKVPLWLAVHFRRKNKCRLIPPYWMNIEYLEKMKQSEQASDLFTKMPSEHYMAVARILFECCAIDIPAADCIKTLIKVKS